MEFQTHYLLSLEAVIAPWPIASTLSSHLGAGDLISLARTSTGLRAVLHGFEKPLPIESAEDQDLGIVKVPKTTRIRHSLNIGFHDTLYWQRLKEEASFVCSSPTHIRGDKFHACRLCSKPICEACIVRSSFQRGKENTFNNRVRYFCTGCWDEGNVTKSRRFPLSSTHRHPQWYSSSDTAQDHCTCTLKADGWLCLECKDRQNYEAATSEVKICHGEGCNNPIGAHHERRRTCIWCQKTLPSPFGGASRHVWTQQMIDAKQRSVEALSADIEEYNRARLQNMRMTRRQLRGEDAVKDDPDADIPQYVRHLDTVNYEHYMGHSAAPSGQEVYDSKRGYWRYSKRFLASIQHLCRKVPLPLKCDLSYIQEAASEHARTNEQKIAESKVYDAIEDIEKRFLEDFSDEQKQKFNILKAPKNSHSRILPGVFSKNLWRAESMESEQRVAEWHALKAQILDMFFTHKVDLLQARVHFWHNFGFWAEKAEFEIVLTMWGQDFDAIEQPEVPWYMDERDEIRRSWENLEGVLVEGSEDWRVRDEQAARLYEEWDRADERMGPLAATKSTAVIGDDGIDDDESIEEDMDQETILQLCQSQNMPRAAASEEPIPSSSSSSPREKKQYPPAETGKVPSYLDALDAQLMGGLARYSSPDQQQQKRKRDGDMETRLMPMPLAARATPSTTNPSADESLVVVDDDDDDCNQEEDVEMVESTSSSRKMHET